MFYQLDAVEGGVRAVFSAKAALVLQLTSGLPYSLTATKAIFRMKIRLFVPGTRIGVYEFEV